jgi:hypothetical protein
MKKLLIGLAFSFICFSGFALELPPPYNACGAEDVATMVMQIEQNLCEGDYQIHDICNLDEYGQPYQYHVRMSYDGPNSSCANPE